MRNIQKRLGKSVLGCAVGAPIASFAFVTFQNINIDYQPYLPAFKLLLIALHPDWSAVAILTQFTFLLMITFVLPAQFIMQKQGITALLAHVLLVIGLITLILFTVFLSIISLASSSLLFAVYAAGLLAVTVFWLIRRPDRDAKPLP